MTITLLTSLQNPKVKLARSLSARKGRREAGLFLVEGTKLVATALEAGQTPAMTFATDAWWGVHGGTAPFAGMGGEAHIVPEGILSAIATTETPDGVVALLPLPDDTAARLPVNALVVIAHRLQDPGNLGTIIRAADAAGADAVVVPPETVDPFSPKAVRATMGSMFHLPVLRQGLAEFARAHPTIPIHAMTLDGADSLYAGEYRGPCAFLIGNEGAGLADEDLAHATSRVTIPIWGGAESLNAAMAATVCLYEAARQRHA